MRQVVLILVAAALAVPAVAAAKTIDVKGPQALLARGTVKGELKMATTDGRPVALKAFAGFVRFIDLDDDLDVRCVRIQGPKKQRGERPARRQRLVEAKESRNAEGKTVFSCLGAAVARGSHFQFTGFSVRFGILAPEGTTGTVTARQIRVRGDEPEADEPPQDDGASVSDEAQAIAELEEALAELGE